MANITKREVITKAIATEGIFTDEEIAVFEKMIEQLDKKSSKPTKAQKENEVFKAQIAEFMVGKEPMTASAIASNVGLSTNKVASLLRAMENVEKIPGKKSKDSPTYRLGEVATE